MREIHLRVWHKRRAMMYYHVEYTSFADGSAGVTMLEEFDKLFPPDSSELEVMLWTGMKDKLGRDIWEGDIVLHQTQPFQPIMKGVISWEDASFSFKQVEPTPEHGDKWVIYKPANETIQVIGTVWEHPDLLTSTP